MAATSLSVGCGSPAGPTTAGESGRPAGSDTAASAPITNTDPCATRLHDLSGGLLLFQFTQGRLPDSLAELTAFEQGPTLPDAVCPVSDKPYVYRSDGVFLQDRRSYVVLHDPAPSHSGIRWAVTFSPPEPGGVPLTKVIALPESFFLLNPPR